MQWIDENCWNSSCKGESWQQQFAFMCVNSTTAAKKRWRCLISSWWNGKFVHQCGVRDRGYLRLNTCYLSHTPLCKCSTGTVYRRHRDSNHGNCCHSTGAPDFLDWQFCVVISTQQASDAASAAASLPPSLSLSLSPLSLLLSRLFLLFFSLISC